MSIELIVPCNGCTRCCQGDAIPRQATKDEVANVGGFALSIFGDA